MNLLETLTIQAGVAVSCIICALVISFMSYNSGTFKCEHTLPLICA
jgi:hypothetical protein